MWRTFPIQTSNLYLRPFKITDAAKAYENWMSDDDVTEFLTWDTHRSPEESENIIGKWVREYEYGTMEWCIVHKRKEEPIGSIAAVQDFPEMRYCEIGYCIGKEHWGKGYMTETVKAVTEYIFRNTDYIWIQARCDSENYGSRKCLEKCGYKLAAVFELPNERMGGEIRTYHMMSIERKDIRM
ncbi:acetyltransferase (GNAT) family protein [Candidatus Methanoplasma termitum]|uniref:Acetyltransferase (GNAT) family protein n=1 Tax=Candidatus Methanoplasma termitum TaxID=1577791 RepID=A0A0A7LB55_9ARCH|nr:GNAT family N-acetyltransferase [Candidatus Methanoplasma termitum]AIZ56233.1 acetyltransferase (GNAT) family protein [Candidatus Methanoplasma termitum]MCL2334379.1 GNAT family N-acetyltransferase [Candidatus Methanoplasma sp.]